MPRRRPAPLPSAPPLSPDRTAAHTRPHCHNPRLCYPLSHSAAVLSAALADVALPANEDFGTSPLTRARPRPSAPTPHLHSYTSLQSHRYRCWFMSLVGTGRCSFCSPSGRVPSPPRGAATRRPRPPRLPRQAARPRRSRQSIARRKAAPRGKGGGGAEGARSSSTTLSLSLVRRARGCAAPRAR